MVNELKHKAVGGNLTQTEFEAVDAHEFEGQTTDDLLVATSATQLSRLAVAASRIIGKKATGNIGALTGAEIRTIIDFIAQARSAVVSDTAYASSWDGVTTIAPSKNALYDQMEVIMGEGHITILSWNYNSIGQGTWYFNLSTTNHILSMESRNGTANNGDNITYKAYLQKGTYTLRMMVAKASTFGIMDVYVDAVEVASLDLYNASTIRNQFVTETGIVIAASGLKDLKFIADGKNGSSSSFQMEFSLISLWRTA